MDRMEAVALLFAMYGQEKATERIRAYLIAFSDLADNQLQFALRKAAQGEIGDPAFLPTAPQLMQAALTAPPPPVKYQNLAETPPLYEMLPNNRKRVTREAIAYWGKEQVEQWIDKTITDAMLEDTSNENPILSPPKQSPQLPKQKPHLQLVDRPNGIVRK